MKKVLQVKTITRLRGPVDPPKRFHWFSATIVFFISLGVGYLILDYLAILFFKNSHDQTYCVSFLTTLFIASIVTLIVGRIQ